MLLTRLLSKYFIVLPFFFFFSSVGHLYSAQTRIALWGEHLNRKKVFVICHTLKLNF